MYIKVDLTLQAQDRTFYNVYIVRSLYKTKGATLLLLIAHLVSITLNLKATYLILRDSSNILID